MWKNEFLKLWTKIHVPAPERLLPYFLNYCSSKSASWNISCLLLSVNTIIPSILTIFFDHPARLQYCQWFLEQLVIYFAFITNVLYTDEVSFTRKGIFNFHNENVWANINPRVIRETSFPYRYSINVWAGIVDDRFIVPHLLSNHFWGISYLRFLRRHLPIIFEDILLNVRK